MSTRSRRSTAADAGGLNPATIFLLPISKLKEELQNRGLDINGSKEELAIRLDEYIQLAGNSGYKPFDPSPTISTTAIGGGKGGRGRKRKYESEEQIVDAEDAERENIETSNKSLQKPIIQFKWATEKPTSAHTQITELTLQEKHEKKLESPVLVLDQPTAKLPISPMPMPQPDVSTPVQNDQEQLESKFKKSMDAEVIKSHKNRDDACDEPIKVKLKKKKHHEKSTSVMVSSTKPAVNLASEERKKHKHAIPTQTPKSTSAKPLIKPRIDISSSIQTGQELLHKKVQKTDREKHKEKEGIKVHDAERIKLKQKKKEEQRRMSGTLTSSSTTHTATSVCGSIEQRRFSSNPTPKQTLDQKPTRTAVTIPSRLNLLESIMDEQEQLLAGKKARKSGAGEEEEDELLKLEMERRQQRRMSGIFSSSTTTPSAAPIEGQRRLSNSAAATVSFGSKTDTSQQKSHNYKFPTPLPPLPPAKSAISPKAPTISSFQQDDDKYRHRHPSTSSFSLPLVVDIHDPLGLSSVSPDTPPPPPPPPPPASTRPHPHHHLPVSLINAMVLPPPPPPPPRRTLIQQQQSEQSQHQQKPQSENKHIETEVTEEESIQLETATVVSSLTEIVSRELDLEEGELHDTNTYTSVALAPSPSRSSSQEDILQSKEGYHRKESADELLMIDEGEGNQQKEKENSPAPETSSSEVDDDQETTTGETISGSEQDDEDLEAEDEDEEDIEAEENIINGNEDGETSAELRNLLKDPKALLHKASDVLRKKFGTIDISETEPHVHYEQVALSMEELKQEEDEEYRQLPDPDQFHGEPVPDDMDDDLFEIAAGLPLREKKRDNEPQQVEEEPLPNEEQIELDFYNSDLNMKASANNKWLIEPDNGDGFALMWGGVRSNYGVVVPEQRDDMPPVAYQVKIAELLSLKHLPFEEPDPHDIRIGWSRSGTSNMLGETAHSFAFNSMANKATGNAFTDYGEPFGLGDVITSVLDINCGEIRYFKNGESLGPAFTDINFETGEIYFPHITTKNCKIFVHFGVEIPEQPPQEEVKKKGDVEALEPTAENKEYQEQLWSMPADEVPEGTKWVVTMDLQMMSPSQRPISDKAHCTIIAMVGLSGVGKTTWVRQYLKEHPDENWVLLNTDTILQAMAVNGVPRQRVHEGRWDMVMGLTAKSLMRSLQMACRRRHNYILDQTNVSRESRKKKLAQFQDFQRKCVVIIPSEAEHERRLIRQAREQGGIGQMPAEAMLEMKGNFSIPSTECEPVEDVIYIEPPIERINEAIEQVRRYNEEGKPWVRQQQQRYGRHRGPPQSIISDHSNLPFVGVTRICV